MVLTRLLLRIVALRRAKISPLLLDIFAEIREDIYHSAAYLRALKKIQLMP